VTWPGDEHDEDEPGRPPLPPDDRIWRHPSELAAGVAAPIARPPTSPRRPAWWLLVIAFGAGVGVTLAGVVLSGRLQDDDPVVEQVEPSDENDDPSVVAEEVMSATVHLHVTSPDGDRDGSGVMFRDDGHILTTADLVAGATAVRATLGDGMGYDATVVGTDPITDLAVVDIEGEVLPTAVLGSAADLQVGERILAVGSAPSPTAPAIVTLGVVQGSGIRLETSGGTLYDLLAASEATDLPPGTALIDQGGAVVGVVTGRRGTADPDPGAGALAVPIEAAWPVAEQLITDGTASHAWLGAEIPDDQRPAALSGVVEGSPAAVAGLRADDVITAVEGQPTESGADVAWAVLRHAPDDHVTVAFTRGDQAMEVDIRLAAHPTA
jgi:putative serine protease PepD